MTIVQEMKKICKNLGIKYVNKQYFLEEIDFDYIAINEKLSEQFIEKHIDEFHLKYIAEYQQLTEHFIEKYIIKFDLELITKYQKLSEKFIEKYITKFDLELITKYQKLSEKFIEKYITKFYLDLIAMYQSLSDSFIKKHLNKFNLDLIAKYQSLSDSFIKKYLNEEQKKIQLKKHHDGRTEKEKFKEIKTYCKKYNLEIFDTYFVAYRDHDSLRRGSWNKTISYESGKYYRDWRCDLDKCAQNSFGLGIWPVGNTKVKVLFSDWGCAVYGDNKGKARVLGFEVIKEAKE